MENYYELLGIDPKSNANEIKRAYFKKIRKYSPEKDENNFKRVREAYEVLSDPQTKKEYDEIITLSPLLRDNFLTAKEEMEQGFLSNAIARLKEILKYQETDLVKVTLADAYLLNKNTGNAVKLYEELASKHPTQNVYKSKLGSAYVMRGWHKKAMPILKEALENDQEDVGNWLALSEAYMEARELEKSIEVLDLALQKNFALELQCMCFFSKLQKQMMMWNEYGVEIEEQITVANEVKQFATKVKAETSKEDEIREMLAGILMKLCQMALYEEYFEVAEVCLNRVQTLIYVDSEMKQMIKTVEAELNIRKELETLYDDDMFDEDFINMITFCIIQEQILGISKAEYEFGRSMSQVELAQNYKKYVAQIKNLKEKHPKLYDKGKDFFERLEVPSERKKMIKAQKKSGMMEKGFIEGLLNTLGMCDEFDDFDPFEDFDEFEEDFNTLKQEPVRKQKIGRNEPCPCGSGKKYKQCCGRN